jgi:hypothetical protein
LRGIGNSYLGLNKAVEDERERGREREREKALSDRGIWGKPMRRGLYTKDG